MKQSGHELQADVVADISSLCEWDTSEIMNGREDMRLFFILEGIGRASSTACIDPDYMPATAPGVVLKDLLVEDRELPHRSRGACHEAEPYFMESLTRFETGSTSRQGATLFLDETQQPVAFQKNVGANTTLVVRSHPAFASLPAGTIVSTHPVAVGGHQSNPYLSVVSLTEAPVVSRVGRPTTFILQPEEVAAWGYDIERPLGDRNLDYLLPYSQRASSTTLDEVVERVDTLLEQVNPQDAVAAVQW